MDDEKQTFASEMYEDLKNHTMFLRKTILWLVVIIGILVAALTGTNLYHIHQWSQFDTVVVDSGGGGGNANYVQGDNTGGINNGTGSSASPEGRTEPGDTGEGS